MKQGMQMGPNEKMMHIIFIQINAKQQTRSILASTQNHPRAVDAISAGLPK